MFNKNSKIVVIGAGGVGGITAALLAKAGYNVKVVCKYPELADDKRDRSRKKKDNFG